ncbi:hypothetical protein [Floricoccus penangensis]|uniref:hypothetical protein n=1 Tax=Floricoccus penangensis TaxID=1859475 RepID=UPI00203F54C7|nr:hypothetical protein [Floricoccus penangensis]URZ86664.1 hypothetical protein KIW23_06085 [Floricoccus penangensis]
MKKKKNSYEEQIKRGLLPGKYGEYDFGNFNFDDPSYDENYGFEDDNEKAQNRIESNSEKITSVKETKLINENLKAPKEVFSNFQSKSEELSRGIIKNSNRMFKMYRRIFEKLWIWNKK